MLTSTLMNSMMLFLMTSSLLNFDLSMAQEIFPLDASSAWPSSCLSGEVFDSDSSSCVSAVDESICSLTQLQSLATVNMPSLAEGPVGVAGSLALQIRHAFTATRQVTAVILNGDNPACNYPTSEHWLKGVSNAGDVDLGQEPLLCSDLFNATVPWLTATGDDGGLGCGLLRSETSDWVIYDGTADVYFTEQLPSQRNQLVSRDLASRLYFRLRFPKSVSASTELVQYDDPRLLAAVTQQEWNPETLAADAELQLQLQAPFKVARMDIVSSPEGIVSTGNPLPSQDCADESGEQVCTQVFGAQLMPNSTVCRLDGQYQFDVTLACQDDVLPEDCPINPNAENPPVRITASLQSEDLCALAETSVGASGQLSVHRSFDELNFQFGDPQSAFFQDQVMHFRLQLAALDGFELASSTIEQVAVNTAANQSALVYSVDAGSATPWQFTTIFDSASAGDSSALHVHQFEFVADPAVYGDVAEDSSYASTVDVVCAIEFSGNSGTPALRKRTFRFPLLPSLSLSGDEEAKKRQLNDDVPPEFVEASARFQMQGLAEETEGDQELPVDPPLDDDGLSWIPFAAAASGAAVCLTCCTLVAFYIFRRRRKEEEEKGRV